MSEQHKYDRRGFLGAAAMTLASSEFLLTNFPSVKSKNLNLVEPTNIDRISNNSFETIKQNSAEEIDRLQQSVLNSSSLEELAKRIASSRSIKTLLIDFDSRKSSSELVEVPGTRFKTSPVFLSGDRRIASAEMTWETVLVVRW